MNTSSKLNNRSPATIFTNFIRSPGATVVLNHLPFIKNPSCHVPLQASAERIPAISLDWGAPNQQSFPN